jgi:hypothetical protein
MTTAPFLITGSSTPSLFDLNSQLRARWDIQGQAIIQVERHNGSARRRALPAIANQHGLSLITDKIQDL